MAEIVMAKLAELAENEELENSLTNSFRQGKYASNQ